MVVNKLIEIISYIRVGSRGGKRVRKKEKKNKASHQQPVRSPTSTIHEPLP